ncbi:MAG: hypothetical protein DRO12_01205 [Thermoprotei archaeon]|nr:MAG: hypothetical protein DRO12_01205 [Thermoprotei archaeon]
MSSEWVEATYVKNASLFIEVLRRFWSVAKEESKLLVRLLRMYGVDQGARVLEVGCGDGRITTMLSLAGYQATGLDISPKLIEEAQRNSSRYGAMVEYVVGDARRIDEVLEGYRFDAVVFYWGSVIGYYGTSTDEDIFRRCCRITSENAKLLILRQPSKYGMQMLSFLNGYRPIHDVLDLDELLVIQKYEVVPGDPIMNSTWFIYKRKGKQLELLGELCMKMHLYTPEELAMLAKRSCWRLLEVFIDLSTLRMYSEKPLTLTFSAVFEKQR